MIPCPSINLRNEREGGIEVKFNVKDSSVVLLLENYENQFFFFNTETKQRFSSPGRRDLAVVERNVGTFSRNGGVFRG